MKERLSGFWWTLSRAVLDPPKARRWPVYALGLMLVSTLALSATVYGGPPADGATAVETPAAPELEALMQRAVEAKQRWHRVGEYYRSEVAPIKRVLLEYRGDPELANRIALALVREARRVGIEPRVLLAVMLVENPWLDPDARSFVGAVGLMQIMPLHKGGWPACPPKIQPIEANICYGASIFAHYLRAEDGNIEEALLRYNGCVNGTNTPNCHRYPYHVYARAGRASLFAWLKPQPARATAR